mmetsp:Transcript_22752/g.31838  ORF Transcript_22752/g.31838 Transcript_22752/m.31838 type:complete len:88 (+) Transcript_22752:1095-1358(+)
MDSGRKCTTFPKNRDSTKYNVYQNFLSARCHPSQFKRLWRRDAGNHQDIISRIEQMNFIMYIEDFFAPGKNYVQKSLLNHRQTDNFF